MSASTKSSSFRRLLQGWRGWRAFKQLSWDWRNIVVYSETGQDWHQFSAVIQNLNTTLDRRVCYVTSDPADPAFEYQNDNFRVILIPEGLFLTIFFQVNAADVFVLTMMDLGNLQLKRSLQPVHYIYLFHSMGSTHMVDHADSFDHYDSLFCTGPHQVAEIRRREELKGLPVKHLFDYGHPRLEQVMREGQAHRETKIAEVGSESADHVETEAESVVTTVLIAPTWGNTSLFNFCGADVIEPLLEAGYKVIMRPHYQSIRLTPDVISALREQFEGNPSFDFVDQMGETRSILESDVLITDWSAMALEYSLGLQKPVLFVDVPRRIRNPDWQEWGLEPVESSIREKAGKILSPDELSRLPAVVEELLQSPVDFRQQMAELSQKMVFRLGHSVPDGAAEIARIADQCRDDRLERESRDG